MTSKDDQIERARMRGTTKELAKLRLVQPQSIRRRYCVTGEYFGLRPTKLPNGRLSWPLDQEEGNS